MKEQVGQKGLEFSFFYLKETSDGGFFYIQAVPGPDLLRLQLMQVTFSIKRDLVLQVCGMDN